MRTQRSNIAAQFQLDAIRAHLIFPVNLHVLQLAEIQFVLSKCSPEVTGSVTHIPHTSQMLKSLKPLALI